jgi:hypothetical protein
MGLSITPGYDFGLNEIPTASTWGKQGSDVLLQDIPLSSIDSDLGTVGLQGSSSPSNLPNEGSLWVDHQTNVWGRTRWGALKVRTYGGAMETNRFAVCGLGQTIPLGWRVNLWDDGSNITTASAPTVTTAGVNGCHGIFVAAATIASGCSLYPRLIVGPGFVPAYHLKRNTSALSPPRREQLAFQSDASFFLLQGYNSPPSFGWEGDIMSHDTPEVVGESSATSSLMYLYGGAVGGNVISA